jgi:hypothetical protein
MTRIRFALAVALLVSLVAAPAVFAQAKSAQAPATKAAASAPTAAQAPAAPAKWVKPIKGTAKVEFLQGPSKKVGNDIVTLLKVKNVSEGSIALLKIDEYWYDKAQKVATGDTERYTKPFNPGDIIEMTMKSPFRPALVQRQFQFSHAGGDVKVTPVKKM